MKLIGLDYGTKTVGVAATDELGLMAHSLETIKRDKNTKIRKTLARIDEICKERNVEKIILGLPVNMDGEVGERAKATISFKELVEKRTGLDVVLWDERCTTIEANEILEKSRIDAKDRKQYIDKIAASIILQDYIDNNLQKK